MRYAQGGGLTPGEQEKRERLRRQAAERFARGDKTEDIARDLRVTARSVRRWRRAWREGGADALRSRGPMAVERLSPVQWARLERELQRGPLAHGWDDEGQGWTLKRVKLLIGRMFHVGYTVQGVWKLLRRHGWSAQVPSTNPAPPNRQPHDPNRVDEEHRGTPPRLGQGQRQSAQTQTRAVCRAWSAGGAGVR
jgi:transposase